jgi:cephalosporin-C deacetylase-like acetyl esterase
MVLVHGGGGTAFADWVKLWVARGYAAIAMDLCGCLPRKGKSGWERLPDGGPPGWGGFDQIDQPAGDQWTYHAVADVLLAHSLLRSYPEIDPEKIGITGISWGGYLTCIAASIDARFKFAAPVYGCGFLGDDSTWLGTFEKMGKEKAAKWLGLWDPSGT